MAPGTKHFLSLSELLFRSSSLWINKRQCLMMTVCRGQPVSSRTTGSLFNVLFHLLPPERQTTLTAAGSDRRAHFKKKKEKKYFSLICCLKHIYLITLEIKTQYKRSPKNSCILHTTTQMSKDRTNCQNFLCPDRKSSSLCFKRVLELLKKKNLPFNYWESLINSLTSVRSPYD